MQVFAGSAAALRATARFDLALVNIVPDLIVGDLEALVAHLRSEGELVLSGLLAAQRPRVASRLRSHGLRVVDTLRVAEWACLRARRFDSPSARR